MFEESSDGPEEDRLNEYTAVLSENLCTTAIGFLIVESDLLIYTLARDGCVLDYFNSWPDYFDETLQTDDAESPSGNADLLIAEVGPNALAEDIRAILDGEYDFARNAWRPSQRRWVCRPSPRSGDTTFWSRKKMPPASSPAYLHHFGYCRMRPANDTRPAFVPGRRPVVKYD